MKTIIFFLVSMFFFASCGDNQRSGNRVPKSQMKKDSTVATSDDSISRLYNSAYSSYMDFFAELEVDYVYGEGDSGEMRKSYTFVDGDGENVTIEVQSDSSIAIRRPGKIYQISFDEHEKFVYWAKTFAQTESTEYWSVDRVKLSSFGDLQHALLLPKQMLHQAKTASIKQHHKENIARREKLTDMANDFRQ